MPSVPVIPPSSNARTVRARALLTGSQRTRLRGVLLACLAAASLVQASAAGITSLFVSAPEPHPVFNGVGTQTRPVDHALWQRWLTRWVDARHPSGINRVRYAQVDARGRADVDAYIAQLSRIDPRPLARYEQMAYWINLYNAVTVRTILQHPDVGSIRDIRSGVFSPGPWKLKLVTVAGQALSLDDIEHRILRPLFKDRRVHFAVNCASLGCPNLAAEAYRGERLPDQLDAAERVFLGHRRGVRFDGDTLVLSSIFDWFGSDFAPDRAGLLQYLAPRVPGALGRRIENHRGSIEYEYDWALNKP